MGVDSLSDGSITDSLVASTPVGLIAGAGSMLIGGMICSEIRGDACDDVCNKTDCK